MDYNEIQQGYSKVMGKVTSTYYGGLERLRNNGDLSEGERQHQAWSIYDHARELTRQATAERNQKLAERERSLKRKLFGDPGGGLVPAEAATRAAFSDAIGRAAVADDDALARMAAAAEHTGDSVLARAVFAESHRRGRGDLMQHYLQGNDEAREKFGEFSQIPSTEERERSLERAPQAIPEPTSAQIAPTREAHARALERNINTRPMAG